MLLFLIISTPDYLYFTCITELFISFVRIYEFAEISYFQNIYEMEACLETLSAISLLGMAAIDGFTIYREVYNNLWHDIGNMKQKLAVKNFYYAFSSIFKSFTAFSPRLFRGLWKNRLQAYISYILFQSLLLVAHTFALVRLQRALGSWRFRADAFGRQRACALRSIFIDLQNGKGGTCNANFLI